MKKVECLEDLEIGEFVYLIKKDGKTEIVIKLDLEEPELKARFVKSQYPISGDLEYLSDKDWEEKYLHKYRVSGENSWYKEYEEI